MGLRADPSEMVLSGLGLGEAGGGQVRVWCNLPGRPLAITGFTLSDKATAGLFQVAWDALPEAAVRRKKGPKAACCCGLP